MRNEMLFSRDLQFFSEHHKRVVKYGGFLGVVSFYAILPEHERKRGATPCTTLAIHTTYLRFSTDSSKNSDDNPGYVHTLPLWAVGKRFRLVIID